MDKGTAPSFKPMRIYGTEVRWPIVADAILFASQNGGFTAPELEDVLRRRGVPGGGRDPVAYRCVDRAVQKLRKLGLASYAGGYWHLTDEARDTLSALSEAA